MHAPGVDELRGALPSAEGHDLAGAQADHVVHIRDGHTGLRRVGGDHDLELVRLCWLECEQLLVVGDVGVHREQQRLEGVCGKV